MRFLTSIQENILWFDIAMQNPALMGVVDRLRQLEDDLRCATHRHRLAPNEFVQLSAFHELHTEIATAIALAHLVDRHDARMLESSGRLSFATKAFQMGFSCPRTARDHFQSDDPVETLLACSINHALPTAPDFLQQFVIAKIHHWRCASVRTLN